MPQASYQQTSFLGGELSKAYSGRYDLGPAYRISLAVCLNFMPIDTGALVRRGGTQFCGTTRGGNPGRTIAFDVAGGNPIYMEFTDLFLRFRLGSALVTTNDAQAIVAISSANPAVVQTTTATTWATGNSAIIAGLGVNNPRLQNRQVQLTKIDTTHFSLQDALTGASIDGSSLGSFVSGTISRVLEIATNYGAGSWALLRSVQAENQTVLLNGSQPQVLTLSAPPTLIAQPTFTLLPSNFLDGPYLDPFAGSICTYDVLVGNVTLTFSFLAWSSTVSYSLGDYVLSGGNGYQSLSNANLNNAPPNAAFWQPVPGGAPVGPSGFTGGDVGRHIRLFSEPPPWAAGTYAQNAVVKYNGAYYSSIAGGNTAVPGVDATKWAVVTGAQYAVWTWGRIISISGAGLFSPAVAIGNYGSLAAAFDGTVAKSHGTCATASVTVTTYPAWIGGINYNNGDKVYYQGNFYTRVGSVQGTGQPPTNASFWTFIGAATAATLDEYAGQDSHGSPKQIASATFYPSNDAGFGSGLPASFTLNLRAKHSAPSSPSDGTLLGTVVIGNTTGAVTITSSDAATSWEYFWGEMTATANPPLPDNGSHVYTMTFYLAQMQFFIPNVNNGSVVTIQLAGPPLLYVAGTVVNTWRAGVYGNAVGWPTSGTYAQGRLWLGGVVGNRFDTSVANQKFNFAPTGPDGTVSASNAISYTLNAPDTNPILWMLPDSQGVLMGTQKREWLVTAASSAAGLGPTNIVANPTTHIGCAAIEPRRTDHTIVFVQKHARKIMEAFADVFSGKFTAPNLLEKARHLTAAAIQEIAYQQELVPVIWARCGDGSLFGLTYKRDTLMTSQGPTYLAPHRHTLGSGRLVESIAVGPSPDGTLDALMMVTNDSATGVRHVELMTPYFEETNTLQNAWVLDDAVVPTSTTSSNSTPAPYGGLTLNGLWHLNGKTVQVFAGGLDCGAGEGGVITDFVVANGSVTVPFGDGISAGSGQGLFTAAFVNSFVPTCPIVVGFAYTSDAQLLRPNTPQDTGARNGPGFAKIKRSHRFGMQVVNTQGLSIGTSFARLDPIFWRDETSDKYPANQLFTGVQNDILDDTYGFDSQVCWRASRVMPAMVTAVGAFDMTQDM